MKAKISIVVLLAIALGGMARHPAEFSDEALLKYARSFQANRNWSSYPKNGSVIGIYRDTPVIAEVRCSDVCPDYTRMVIRYETGLGDECRASDGREVTVRMPFAIAVRNETFCVPRILAEKGLYSFPQM